MKKFKKGKHIYTDLGKGVKRVNKIKEVEKVNEERQQKQIPIKLDEETAMGKYANLCMVAHTPEEFTFDFIFLAPGPPGTTQAKVISRLIVSPGHAKRLQMALNENIAKYELKHGKIASSKGPDRKMGFN